MKSVYNARDEIEANMILECLKQADIEGYAQGNGSGEYMKIVQGFSVFGQDIYVEDEDADKAKAIIDGIISSQEEECDSSEFESVPWYQRKEIVGRVLLVVAAVTLLIVGVLSQF